MVAIDGETQLAARYETVNRDPETQHDYAPVYICYDLSKGWARQAFHYLNVPAVRPNAAVSIGTDSCGLVTSITAAVERSVPFFSGRVNLTRRHLRATNTDATTIAVLQGGGLTVAFGIAGVKRGKKPEPIDAEREPLLRDSAIEWWRTATESIGSAFEDREHSMASAPAVIAAIGAMGHPLVLDRDPGKRAEIATQQIYKLRSVNWRRDAHWDGIAGKLTPKGAVTVAGSKEAGPAVLSALNDEGSEAFQRGRRASAWPTCAVMRCARIRWPPQHTHRRTYWTSLHHQEFRNERRKPPNPKITISKKAKPYSRSGCPTIALNGGHRDIDRRSLSATPRLG